MTTPAKHLLTALAATGYTVRVADGKLLVSPASKLPPGWRAEIAEYRTELIELVEYGAALEAAWQAQGWSVQWLVEQANGSLSAQPAAERKPLLEPPPPPQGEREPMSVGSGSPAAPGAPSVVPPRPPNAGGDCSAPPPGSPATLW